MKIIFLGTNGWYDTAMGDTPCVLIQTASRHLILDAGNGFRKIDRFITDRKPVSLFLSHFHLDHINGLHILNKFDLRQGLRIFGPRGTRKHIGRYLGDPYTMPLKKLKTNVTLHDLREGKLPGIPGECRKLDHPSLCYGYRFSLERKVVAYCTDTGMTGNILRLARDADLLISECSFKSGQPGGTWAHMNPELAADAARRSAAQRLVLTHFDAALYVSPKDRRDAGAAARKIFRNTSVAFDDTIIEL